MPRPRPEHPVLQNHRERLAIVWWEGNRRRRVAVGTTDPSLAHDRLAEFVAKKGPFWEYTNRRVTPADTGVRVYVIGSESGHHKVGISESPKKRLADIQSSHPERLRLVKEWLPGMTPARTLERRVHTLLGARRMSGEWFNVPASVACAAVEISIFLEPYQGLPELRAALTPDAEKAAPA